MKSILNYLYKNTKPWRPRSEVYIIKNQKLVVGYVNNNNWSGYVIPGGGIDYGETPEKAAKRECLEEVGVKVKDLKLISAKKIAYQENTDSGVVNAAKYSREFSGAIFMTFIGYFDGYNDKKHNQHDSYELKEITFDEAIRFFDKNTKAQQKSSDVYNYEKSKYVLETLKKIKSLV